MRLLCKYMCRSPNPLPLLARVQLQLESGQLVLCKIMYVTIYMILALFLPTGEDGNSLSQA